MTTISNFMSTPRAVAVSLAVVLVPSLMVVMVLSFDAHEGAGREAAGCIGFEAPHLAMKIIVSSPMKKT
jgi:ABC-type sulfate transport system permease component